MIHGYAMPVYVHTLPRIGRWLNAPGMENDKQLAFEVHIKFDNEVFSARDIIIDLPGMACLVEAVPNAIPLMKGRLPVESADADTYTAVRLNSDDLVSIANAKDEREESCWFTLLNSTYNPVRKKIKENSHSKTIPSDLSFFTFKTAIERQGEFVNVEQDATPCGGN
ncbi:unnamed protein product [Strongylus vulgaris]|uniref:Uncharacterized protein n=1 Tax=Strongylus vulgaris TaxID=40348 RepID=A0A3P7IVG7_STRVU|nr:unnamed protein product [Strongylus vulgaris]